MAKTILITGASSGFGRLTAETLAESGHRVFAGFRSTDGDRIRAADDLKKRKIQVVKLDVTDEESVGLAVKNLLAQTNGELDVVINNAGIASAGISETFTSEQLHDLFDVNVFGIHRVIRATLPTMRKKQSGLIINIGSILGRVTIPFFGLYGASKHAIEALSDGYRYELSQVGVDVVLIQPSAYPTNMYAAAQVPADGARTKTYGDIAEITGKILNVFVNLFKDGGIDPRAVATNIDQVIKMDPGTRPHRVVVGLPFGSDAVNESVAPIQRKLIDDLQLGYLDGLKTR